MPHNFIKKYMRMFKYTIAFRKNRWQLYLHLN
uniref:Uncharacterized protein n=1 Tax=Siphoviridae sp. ctxMM9 TaxID=2827973 RepID=A0A8S5T766_9CAUD|nr:MAG TPA: hypothetical protein [Siphoviridae sp. ctxMM9]